jgi:F-type H+-transporting ATPase subunit alpha
VGAQVVTILAGSSGLLDDVAVKEVNGFANDMLRWMNERYPDLIGEIDKTGKLSNDLSAKITEAGREYKAAYKA